ncbi:MAG: PepSY-associated TM helix domain-containing protein [Saprospiraceae bacterium]
MKQTEKIAGHTRIYRRLHKWAAIPLFFFMFIIGLTGVLLGWKKQANLTPATQKGTGTLASQWISLDSLQKIAIAFAHDSLHLEDNIERLDVRPGKGSAKVLFTNDYTELQIDLTTGQVISVQKRWNDLVEQIHDGTIADRLLGTEGDPIKTTYTTLTSAGLMVLAFSGFWMWWNPRRIRRMKGISY